MTQSNDNDGKYRYNRKGFLEDDESNDDSILIVDPGWDDYCLQELKLNRPVPCCPDARRARILTPQLHESAGGLPSSLNFHWHSVHPCQGARNAMGNWKLPLALGSCPRRDHECNGEVSILGMGLCLHFRKLGRVFTGRFDSVRLEIFTIYWEVQNTELHKYGDKREQMQIQKNADSGSTDRRIQTADSDRFRQADSDNESRQRIQIDNIQTVDRTADPD
ncbi:hypothetical protein Tco_1045228 [Tanacetum coccineum]|uniref:Uncharacterized protein n=1 Tax=Tanacetum coccineum TaxID=301880 RepID=A0ABQ5GUN7_9ASTR